MGIISTGTSYLGIDIGSSGIKMVELKKEGGRPKLVTYGFSENNSAKRYDWQKDLSSTAKVINKIWDNSGAVSKSAVSALPTFSVFSSVINLTNVNKKEIANAVQWEAKKVIPLPLDEMILDWKNIPEDKNSKKNSSDMRVLLIGAPQSLVKKYIEVFKVAQISLLSLETETFSLIRSLIGNDTSTMMLVEIGATTTDVTIVDNKIPMLNRSIDIGGANITQALHNRLHIDEGSAEQFKYDIGIAAYESNKNKVVKVIQDVVSPIVNEIKYAVNLFETKNKKKAEKVILSGGSVMIPGFIDYLEKILDIKVIYGNPWSRISYPEELRPLLEEIGPRMSVAVGLALREME